MSRQNPTQPITRDTPSTPDETAAVQSLWSATAPPPPVLARLRGHHRVDVAVIGGGYTGLSAALHLAEAGTEVILLEARDIGFGGSGRNVGLVNAGLWLMPEDIVAKLGPDLGERLLSSLGNSPDLVFECIEKYGIPCEAVRNGTLHCAHSPGGFRALTERASQWKQRGAPVTLLDRKRAAPMIGSNAFHGALLDLRAGTVQPLAYANGLAHGAVRAGAHLRTHSPVTAVSRVDGRWRLTTPLGTVSARAVILAVHAYPTGAFSEHKKQLIPFNFFQFSTPPLSDRVRRSILPGGHGAWDTNLVLSSFRLDAAGRLIIGSVGQIDRFGYGIQNQWAHRMIRTVFPQAAGVKWSRSWFGRIAMTVDHLPRLHLLGPDFVTVTSYNGRGIGPGTLFGKLLAGVVQGGDLRRIPLPVSPQRPIAAQGLRGLYYETGARLYHFTQWRQTR